MGLECIIWNLQRISTNIIIVIVVIHSFKRYQKLSGLILVTKMLKIIIQLIAEDSFKGINCLIYDVPCKPLYKSNIYWTIIIISTQCNKHFWGSLEKSEGRKGMCSWGCKNDSVIKQTYILAQDPDSVPRTLLEPTKTVIPVLKDLTSSDLCWFLCPCHT